MKFIIIIIFPPSKNKFDLFWEFYEKCLLFKIYGGGQILVGTPYITEFETKFTETESEANQKRNP